MPMPPKIVKSYGPSSKECWYFVKDAQKYHRKDIAGEDIKLKAKMDVDSNMRAALTDAETGLLKAGALPKVSASSAQGNKALLDAIDKAGCWWLRGLISSAVPTTVYTYVTS